MVLSTKPSLHIQRTYFFPNVLPICENMCFLTFLCLSFSTSNVEGRFLRLMDFELRVCSVVLWKW